MSKISEQIFGIRSVAISRSFSCGKLDLLADCGFNAVELSFNYESHELDWRDKQLGAWFCREKERLDLKFSAHCPDYLHLTHPDHAIAAEFGEELREIIAGISNFGVDQAVIHADGGLPLADEPGQIEKQRDNLIENLRSVEPVCRENKIMLLLETMTPTRPVFTSGLEHIMEVLQVLASPWLGVCIDVNHLNLSLPPHDGIINAGQALAELHCSDNYGEQEEHRMIGDGIIDWEKIATALSTVNFQGFLILETNNYNEDLNDKQFLSLAATKVKSAFSKLRYSHQ